MNILSNAQIEQQEQELLNHFVIEEMEERLETSPWGGPSCYPNNGPNY
jgi:hypothetical protein